MKFTLTILLLAICSITFGQEKFTLSGTVSDSLSGEAMINATIRVKGQNIGAISNEYGFYSITLAKGSYTIVYSSMDYSPKEFVVDLTKNNQRNVQLAPYAGEFLDLKEVNATAKKNDQNITEAVMGIERLNPQEIAKIPVLLGEKDIIKTMQLLPGVKSAGEGNSGFYVVVARGTKTSSCWMKHPCTTLLTCWVSSLPLILMPLKTR